MRLSFMDPFPATFRKLRNPGLFFLILLPLLFPFSAFSQPYSGREPGIQKGLHALYRKDISAAIRQFESIGEQEGPHKSTALYYLGYAYYLNGQYPESRRAFLQGYEISPEQIRLLQEQSAAQEAKEEKTDSPEPPVETVNPRFQKGIFLLAAKNFPSAAEEFKAATQETPSHAGFLYYMGYSLYKLKKFQEARAAFLDAYRVQPDYIPPLPQRP